MKEKPKPAPAERPETVPLCQILSHNGQLYGLTLDGRIFKHSSHGPFSSEWFELLGPIKK